MKDQSDFKQSMGDEAGSAPKKGVLTSPLCQEEMSSRLGAAGARSSAQPRVA